MLTILSEDFGAASLRETIGATVAAHKKCILLVPEQETLHAETVMASFLSPDAPLYFEVSNFSRLANTVFRAVGGISYRYADKATSALLMWKTLDALAPLLSVQASVDESRVKDTLAALNELYAAGVDEDALEDTARKLPSDEPLHEKLCDLATIFRIYKGERKEIFGSHAEDLDRLAAVLEETAFFADTVFFLDSFTSFTAQEYRILSALLTMTDVTVALIGAEGNEELLCYEEIHDTVKHLTALARDTQTPVFRLRGEPTAFPPAILHTKNNLFRADKKAAPFAEDSSSLLLFKASDPFEACAHIAADIAARVRSGARYRDFVIFARDSRPYRGILDIALEKQGIPFFMSVEKDIFGFAAIRMILTAYAVISKGYRREDVIAYLKCGFGEFSDDDIDHFELYTDFWRIGGKAFTTEKDWSMNPFGYKEHTSDTAENILARVNRVKKECLSPIAHLEKACAEVATVREHARALYYFLRETHCEERLLALAAREEAAGKTASAEELSRLFGVICSLLDSMAETLGEAMVGREPFAALLRIVFSSIGLGQLPISQDAVTVGNADMLRADAPRFVYLLGVNEGEFPATVKTGGAFGESERARLEALGLPVGFDPLIAAAREEFCFLRALCSARECAAIFTCATDASGAALYPSSVFHRLEEIFGVAKNALANEVFHPDAAALLVGSLDGTPQGEALRTVLAEDAAYSSAFDRERASISTAEERLSEAFAQKLFPQDMHLTQSRVDAYANCPFAYYCNYLLGLSYKQDASFDFADIGTLIHALLEQMFLAIGEDGKTIKTIQKEDLPRYTDKVCRAYIDAICPQELKDSPRLSHLFERLSRTARLLAEELYDEFAQSKFDPSFFEFKIGTAGAPEPIVFETEDGHRMIFYGTIDRIDTYRGTDGRLYLRVVDYKTGTKAFSVKDVARGRNLQMLIYLFSLWKSRDASFLTSLGLASDEMPLPAGALYMSASPKDMMLDRPLDADTVREQAKKNLARSGLLLQDEEILRAMDATLSGHYVPLATNKDGVPKWTENFASLERMGELLTEMQGALSEIGTNMHRGCADASPASVRDVGRDVCESCAYRAVCRRK